MEQDGAWGDHVILCAAANYFETCIRVVSSLSHSNDVIITPHCPVDESKPLVLGHIHEMHYVSLQPVQGNWGLLSDWLGATLKSWCSIGLSNNPFERWETERWRLQLWKSFSLIHTLVVVLMETLLPLRKSDMVVTIISA